MSKGPEGAPLTHKLANASDRSNFDFPIRGHFLKMKYCSTCMIYRPPRSSHCVECDVCVERFDHHCPWVGNCVAKRNYKYFMMFLFFTSTTCMFIMISCSVHIHLVSESDGVLNAIEETIPSILLLIYSFGFWGFTFGMFWFHSYLVYTGQTKYEKLKHT